MISPGGEPGRGPGADAALAVAVFALDPPALGGVVLRAAPGPARDAWLGGLRAMAAGPVRKMPLGIAEDRLMGGLDLAATLAAGAPRAQRGLLAEADGGILLVAMAERMMPGTAARVAQAMDTGRVGADPARFGVVLLDEGIDDEHAPAALTARAAIHLTLDQLDCLDAAELARPRALLPTVAADDAAVEALCSASLALGVHSGRAPLFALRVACAAAALDGRRCVVPGDVSLAARLVLAPRATRLPAPEPEAERPEPPPRAPDAADQDSPPEDRAQGETLADQVLDAARAAIPPGLLAMLQQPKARARTPGKSGAATSGLRGRPLGARPGQPRDGRRLDLVETLRAAAPWQGLRGGAPPVRIRRDDLRVTRRQQRSETTTIFLVDASGSSALNRLAEAKGAVELLLADCYVRRDQVAVLAFRGAAATLLLPPTRSLVRAKRSLASLPGGGGTPLAAALDAGTLLADAIRRRGGSPTVVLLTDGQANVARDGKGGRARAQQDALAAARLLRAAGYPVLVIDTAPRPSANSRSLAAAMAARYLPLPYADAASLSRSVKALL